MSNQTGWTQEALLDEALDLIDQIDAETDPAKIEQLDGCFMAVQEAMLAQQAAAAVGENEHGQ